MNAPINPAVLDEFREDRSARPAFLEYVRILSRHRLAIIVLTILFGLLGLLRASMEVPLYGATATLLIDREGAKYVDAREIYTPGVSNFEYFQTQYEILRTRPLMQRVAERVGPQRILEAWATRPPISFGREERSADAPVPTQEEALEYASSILTGAVQISPVRNTQLVRIYFSSPNAQLSADLANALANVYIENTLESRLQMSQDAAQWLSGRLGGLRERVEEAENRLRAFREENSLVGSGSGDSLQAQSVNMLTGQLAAAQSARLDRERAYREVVEAEQAGRPMDQVTAVAQESSVSGLIAQVRSLETEKAQNSARYGPRHPEMVKVETALAAARVALKQQAERVADSIRREYKAAQQVEAEVRSQLERSRNELRTASSNSIRLQQLERDVEAARSLYDRFKAQFNLTSETSKMETSNARVVQAATINSSRTHPNVRQMVLVSALLGLILSIALAFLLDHLDNTVKTAESVEELLQLPVLGLVPSVRTAGKKDTGPMNYFSANPRTAFSEAVRTLRTGVLLSGIDKSHRRLLITSSVPGEGKTTMALNLAQALSQMHKVLLIDTDMRRPTVAKALGDKVPTAGLSQFIAGEAKISDCVIQMEGSNTYLMTAGVIPANPLELLSSNRFTEALDQLGKIFDFILLDAPPALAVSDALVLSKMVDGVLYVIRCDSTPKQAVVAGVKRLRRVDAALIGVLLNRVGERQHGYGYGRYSYYAEGYDQQHYGYYGETRQEKSRGKS